MSSNEKPPTPSPPRPASNPLVPKPPKGSWRDFYGPGTTRDQAMALARQALGYSINTAKKPKEKSKKRTKLRLVKGGKR